MSAALLSFPPRPAALARAQAEADREAAQARITLAVVDARLDQLRRREAERLTRRAVHLWRSGDDQ